MQADKIHLELRELVDVELVIVDIPLVRALSEVVKRLDAARVDGAWRPAASAVLRQPRYQRGCWARCRQRVPVQPKANAQRCLQHRKHRVLCSKGRRSMADVSGPVLCTT